MKITRMHSSTAMIAHVLLTAAVWLLRRMHLRKLAVRHVLIQRCVLVGVSGEATSGDEQAWS